MTPTQAGIAGNVTEQQRVESQNTAFTEWFKERGYPNYPEHYPLITENAMHAAWQEAAKRTAQPVQEPVDGVLLSSTSILAIRDALVEGDINEAYHQLYAAIDPKFEKFEPWEKLEAMEPKLAALSDAANSPTP